MKWSWYQKYTFESRSYYVNVFMAINEASSLIPTFEIEQVQRNANELISQPNNCTGNCKCEKTTFNIGLIIKSGKI